MAIIRQTTIQTIQIEKNGSVVIRIELCIAEGVNKFDVKPVNEAFSPGEDIPAKIAEINAYLATLGYPAIVQPEIDQVIAYSALAWTPEVLAAYQAA